MSARTQQHPDNPRRVVVLGQGYVGLPLAIHAVTRGYDVVGFDVDEHKVARLREGESYTPDVTDHDLAAAFASQRYRISTNPQECRGFDVAIIAVPTPLREGAPDLSFAVSAAETIAPFVRPGCMVVVESSTYPGTTEEIVRPILEKGSGLRAETDFSLGYSPERIDPASDHSFEATPKLVSGVGEASLREVNDFYATLVDRTVPVSGPKVAELAKLLENTFRAVNIALVNEVAMFAGDLGIDIWETIDAAATKPFGFMRFTPGPGVGGHCLPIDPSYLSWQVERRLGVSFRFVHLANDINAHMPDYVTHRIVHALNQRRLPLNGTKILLLGLAYKANTGDTRESPAIAVADHLLANGARVHACDSHAQLDHLDPRIVRVPLSVDEVRDADLVVLLTDHDDIDYEMVAEEATAVLDTRRRLRGRQVEYL